MIRFDILLTLTFNQSKLNCEDFFNLRYGTRSCAKKDLFSQGLNEGENFKLRKYALVYRMCVTEFFIYNEVQLYLKYLENNLQTMQARAIIRIIIAKFFCPLLNDNF